MTVDMENNRKQGGFITPRLHLVAWEITRSCNLFCTHCRASADNSRYSDELTTEECYRLIDQILEIGRPIIILTGGEPLVRKDVFQIAGYGVAQGLRVVMGTNGTLITDKIALQIKETPVSRVGISLDFPEAGLQDDFRGKAGAFRAIMAGIESVRKQGVESRLTVP